MTNVVTGDLLLAMTDIPLSYCLLSYHSSVSLKQGLGIYQPRMHMPIALIGTRPITKQLSPLKSKLILNGQITECDDGHLAPEMPTQMPTHMFILWLFKSVFLPVKNDFTKKIRVSSIIKIVSDLCHHFEIYLFQPGCDITLEDPLHSDKRILRGVLYKPLSRES